MYEQLTQLLAHVQGMWRYRWHALLVAWLVCAAGWATVYALPDEYQARTRVYLDTESVLKPLLKDLAVDTDVNTRVSLMTQILLSRPNLERVARETDMHLRAKTTKDMERLLARLQRTIQISSSDTRGNANRDNLYEITYTDRDPQIVQRVVQTLVNTLVEGTLGSSREDTVIAQRFLHEQIRDYEARLTAAEQRLAEFKKKHVGMMPSEGRGYYARLEQALDKLKQTRRALKVAENRRSELRKQLEAEELVRARSASNLAAKIQEHQAELDALLLKYTERHPAVLELQQTIVQLKKRRQFVQEAATSERGQRPETSRVYQALKIELSKAEVQAATLRTQVEDQERDIDELKRMVDTIPEVEAKLARLNRDYSVTRTQYETLVQRLESARLSQQAEQSSNAIKFRIIDPPIVPQEPIAPDRRMYLTVVLFGGLLVGAALAFFLHDIHPVFLSARALREVTGLPVLGVVSMKRIPRQRLKLRVELASFVFAMMLLLFAYGGAVMFQDTGVHVTQSLLQMG